MTATRAKTRAERQAELREATTGISDVIRGHEPTATEKREPTATEKLAALKVREVETNGYLIRPPANLYAPLDEPHSCPERTNGLRCCCRVRAWLKAVSEVGSGGHVEIAWVRGVQDKFAKERVLNYYEQVRKEAAMRHTRLEEQASAEQSAARAAHLERTRKADTARSIASLEAQIAALKAQQA